MGREDLIVAGTWVAVSGIVVSFVGIVFWLAANRIAGSEAVGYATTVISAASFVAFISRVGLPTAVLREAPLKGGAAATSALLVGTMVTLAAAVSTSGLFSRLFSREIARYAWLIVVLSVLTTAGDIALATLLGVKAERTYFAVVVAAQATRLGLGLGLATIGLGAYGLILGILLAAVVQFAGSILPLITTGFLESPSRVALRGVLYTGLSNYSLTLSTGLIPSISTLLVAASTGSPVDTGVFYISLMMVNAVTLLPLGISKVGIPRMVEGQGGFSDAARLSLGLTMILATILLVAPGPVLSLAGVDEPGAPNILRLLAPAAVLSAGVQLSSSILNARARFRTLIMMGVARLVTLILATVLLAPELGAAGLALAYTVSTALAQLVSKEWSLSRLVVGALSVQGLAVAPLLMVAGFGDRSLVSMLVATGMVILVSHLVGFMGVDELVDLLRMMVKILPGRRRS